MLLEPFDAEEFAPDWLFTIVWDNFVQSPEYAEYGMLHNCLTN
jgi:hypothetical protein